MSDKQQQKSDDNSTNIQAGNNITVINQQGLTYNDAKQIALDVFKENFYELAGNAKNTARVRGEEITDNFLTKLQAENPSGFAKAEDPDFQHALFTVQKEYARNGDKDLGDLLVDLLIDRSKQEGRDILQIVLNESLNTAPKLTNDQLAVLAVIFLFRYTRDLTVMSHQKLGEYFDKFVLPFAEKLNKREACYQHLEFSGCGSIDPRQITLEAILIHTYQGLFLKGFDAEQFMKDITIGMDDRYFVPCLNDPTKTQVKFVNKESLEKHLDANSINPDDKTKIIQLFDQGKISEHEVRTLCVSIRPYMEQVFETWDSSSMRHFTLTSVGMAIGHANMKRLTGEFADLSIWVN